METAEIHPQDKQPPEASSPLPTAQVVNATTERPCAVVRFVIVDDSAVIRRRLVSMLCDIDGAQLVGEAVDALDGATMIRELNPDLAILDIRMSDRSGISLLEDIKNDPNRPTIIILTNYPYAAYRKRCMELGANHFFDKSTEFTKVEEVVRELVRAGR